MRNFEVKNWHIVVAFLFLLYVVINTHTAGENLQNLISSIER